MEWWEEKGRKAYESLGECTQYAIEDENPEIAVICGYPLLKLAEVEGANYFGTQGYYNYNSAHEMAKEAVKLADKKGVPSWMRDEVKEMKETLKTDGWYKEDGNWKVFYDHVFDGHTMRTFSTKEKALEHIKYMKNLYPYGVFELKKV